jgi:tripartite-type tricarboxylate transporter receptor subunit TctC
MTRFITRRAAAVLVLAASALPALPALAQNPNAGKPLRVILPVGAGSGVDTIFRAASPALGKVLVQPVIENLPGAGGITGTQTLVKSAPDALTSSTSRTKASARWWRT